MTAYCEEVGIVAVKRRPAAARSAAYSAFDRSRPLEHYILRPLPEPVLRIAPGDIVVAETKDAFESRIKAETDPTKILGKFPSSIRSAGLSPSKAPLRHEPSWTCP